MILNSEDYFQINSENDKVLNRDRTYFLHSNLDDAYYWYVQFSNKDSFKVHPINTIVPENVLDKVRSKELFLILDNAYEGFLDVAESIYSEVVVKFNLPPEQITVVSGNFDLVREIRIVARQYQLPEARVEFFNFWERHVLDDYIAGDYSSLSTLQDKIYDKKYLSLNRFWRIHRTALLMLLNNKNLINQGHISFKQGYDNPPWEQCVDSVRKRFEKNSEILEKFTQGEELASILPLNLDNIVLCPTASPEMIMTHGLDKFYEDTLFSLVTETNIDRNSEGRFITEKSFKPIANFHPFIIVGPAGSLQALRDLGYRTFNGIIDESYDTEEDNGKRLMKIVNEVERLCNMTASEQHTFINRAKDTCLWNYLTFKNKKKYVWAMNEHTTNKITILDSSESASWNLDTDVHFQQYGWFHYKLKLHPDLAWATDSYTKEKHNTEYEIMPYEGINLKTPWFIFLYTYFQYRINPKDTELIESKQLFQGIPKKYIDELVNGNAYLILSCENEAITGNWFFLFYKLYDQNPAIPLHKIIYLTAARNIKEEYEKFCKFEKIPPWRQIQVWYTHHGWLPQIHSYLDRYFPSPKPKVKKFINLNRVPRYHRVVWCSLLASLDLLDKGFVSLGINERDYPAPHQLKTFFHGQLIDALNWNPNGETYKLVQEGHDKLLSALPLRVDKDDMDVNYVNYGDSPMEFFDQCWFSVVSSTYYFIKPEPGLTVNEKEFKAILSKHPFLILNRPGTLKLLREMGFKTFDKWFDESYDEEISDEVRMLKLAKEVRRLCDLSDSEWEKIIAEMQPVLNHNYDWLVRNTGELSFEKTDLKNLLKYAV